MEVIKLLNYCSVANQVRACDVHHSCVMCVCFLACAHQNHVQQCMHTPVFEVLHTLNVQAHACVKFKLSCTILVWCSWQEFL